MRLRTILTALACSATLGACAHAPPQTVVPTSHLVGDGLPVAAYPLRSHGAMLGDVNAQPGKIVRTRMGHRARHVLHVALTVDNDSDQIMSVPAGSLTIHGGAGAAPLAPLSIDGVRNVPAVTIGPRQSRSLDVAFLLPRGARHAYVHRFALGWQVSTPTTTFGALTPYAAVRNNVVLRTAPVMRSGPYQPYQFGPYAPYSPFCNGPNGCP